MQSISGNEYRQKIQDGEKMIVKLGSPHCTNCIELSAKLEPLVQDYPEHSFYELDVVENMDIAQELKIDEIPVLIAFKNGKVDSVWNPEKMSLKEWLEFLKI